MCRCHRPRLRAVDVLAALLFAAPLMVVMIRLWQILGER